MKLKLTEHEKLLSKRVYLLSYVDVFLSGALYWAKKLFIFKMIFIKKGSYFSSDYFPTSPQIKS